jgi:hypothetical protein
VALVAQEIGEGPVGFGFLAAMGIMKLWWWISGPYSIVFPVLVILSNGGNVMGPPFVLSWITAASSAAWAVVTLIIRWTRRDLPWSQNTVVMLALSLVASLWLLQPLGVLKWLALG